MVGGDDQCVELAGQLDVEGVNEPQVLASPPSSCQERRKFVTHDG